MRRKFSKTGLFNQFSGSCLLRSQPFSSPIVYISSFLEANTDSYKQLNFAGVPNALALMLLVWLYLFTLYHADEGTALGAAVVQVVKSMADDDEGTGESTGEDAAALPVVEDTEF